jgi:hypothetical protein
MMQWPLPDWVDLGIAFGLGIFFAVAAAIRGDERVRQALFGGIVLCLIMSVVFACYYDGSTRGRGYQTVSAQAWQKRLRWRQLSDGDKMMYRLERGAIVFPVSAVGFLCTFGCIVWWIRRHPD